MLSRYTKAIVSIVAAALVVLGAALTDDVVTQLELAQIAIAVVTAVGVYLVPNLDAGPARYAKGIVAFLGAGLAALVTVLSDGVTYSEWITVFLASLGAIGVVILPNLQAAAASVLSGVTVNGTVSVAGPAHLANVTITGGTPVQGTDDDARHRL